MAERPERRRKRNARVALVVGLLCLGLAVAIIALAPRAINSAHATQIPTPGQVTLPPTAPPAPVATATSK